MISLEYAATFQTKETFNLLDRLDAGLMNTMQIVLDRLVENIKSRFTDNDLADTVTSFTEKDTAHGTDIAVTGTVTSTWQNMIWYEKGRPPGGKMPPRDAILRYIERHGIQPDPAKAALAFAFAINTARLKKNKHAVPLDALVEWQNRAGIVIPEDFQLNSMAFAIGKKIVKEGIPGRHYFELGLEQTTPFINESFESMVFTATGVK